jgi:hypothetical protein
LEFKSVGMGHISGLIDQIEVKSDVVADKLKTAYCKGLQVFAPLGPIPKIVGGESVSQRLT